MTLQETVYAAISNKTEDNDILNALKVIKSDIQRAKTKIVNDKEVQSIIKKYISGLIEMEKYGEDNHKIIEYLRSLLPKEATEDDVREFVKKLDFSKYRNKMQAMGDIMKEFKNIDGNMAKRVLMEYDE